MMTFGFLAWLIFILWVLLGSWAFWPADGMTGAKMRPFGANLLLVILLFLILWEVFGFIVQDGPPRYRRETTIQQTR